MKFPNTKINQIGLDDAANGIESYTAARLPQGSSLQ
jgi:hypothetical protein